MAIAAFDLDLDAGKRVEADEVNAAFVRGDGREGIAAFVEKRAPRF